ncbi:MAG: enhanced serine sensitivity protein SseB [Erysipelotrichaceae bacterium]|nr:enhanced serine sensitivity protein SseB [Erysipelotrichaceae bacterium]
MEPLTNPRLRELLDARKENSLNDSALQNVMNQIAEEVVERAKFLAVIQMDDSAVTHNEDGTATFNQGSTITVCTLSTSDGKVFFPAFTDWDAIAKSPYAKTEPKTLVVSFDDYWAMVKDTDAGMVINPGCDDLLFTKETLRRFHEVSEMKKNGVIEHTVEKDTPVQIGDPAENPKKLKDALRACAEHYREIRTMWLKLMVKEGEKSWLLIVDHKGERKPLFEALAKAARPHLENMYIDMVSYSDPFGKKAADDNPFYVRKKTGLFGF